MGDETLLGNVSISSNDSGDKQRDKMDDATEFTDSCSDTDIDGKLFQVNFIYI